MNGPFQPARFDRVARMYRWCEYLCLGRTLEHVRFHLLPEMAARSSALILGEGDGRFLARFLQQHPGTTVEVVDGSPRMQALARARVLALGAAASTRVPWRIADLRSFRPERTYDLIITNFVLDCFTQPELEDLVLAVAPRLAADGIWCNADFCLPQRPAVRFFAGAYIRTLYLGFAVLTGLHVRSLPDDAAALGSAGLQLQSRTYFAGGMLKAELWRASPRMRL